MSPPPATLKLSKHAVKNPIGTNYEVERLPCPAIALQLLQLDRQEGQLQPLADAG
jgi:hypothetical protein